MLTQLTDYPSKYMIQGCLDFRFLIIRELQCNVPSSITSTLHTLLLKKNLHAAKNKEGENILQCA